MKSRIGLVIAVVALSMMGCNKKGSKGDTGTQGPAGLAGVPGGLPDGVIYKGTVNSNTYLVSTPGLDVSLNDLVFVYACDPANNVCDQLNIYNSAIPGNVSYIELPQVTPSGATSPGAIQLDNLEAVNLPNYYITVISRH